MALLRTLSVFLVLGFLAGVGCAGSRAPADSALRGKAASTQLQNVRLPDISFEDKKLLDAVFEINVMALYARDGSVERSGMPEVFIKMKPGLIDRTTVSLRMKSPTYQEALSKVAEAAGCRAIVQPGRILFIPAGH